jgi:hypothetical protein
MRNPPMKALTTRQPFAESILRGRKPFEIRCWRTHYTGPFLIHSGMRMDSELARELGLNPEKLPTSAFVGIAILSEVRPYAREDARLLTKRRAGEGWHPYLFSWVLKKPFRLPRPIKAKGNSDCSTFLHPLPNWLHPTSGPAAAKPITRGKVWADPERTFASRDEGERE